MTDLPDTTEKHGAMELENVTLAMARFSDAQDLDRICAWCFHPRSSDECQFAAMHEPYREWFA